MPTPPETAGSSEDRTEQHDIDELENHEAVENEKECSVRDNLSTYGQVSPTRSANPRAQRTCQVCFDLDIPDSDFEDDRTMNVVFSSAHSYFNKGLLDIPLVLLESTAKAGCPSCELLWDVLRTRPQRNEYISRSVYQFWEYFTITSRKIPSFQTNIIIIR